MEDQDKLFTEGFNNGYLLAKYDPELAVQLIAHDNHENDFFQGLVAGAQEHEIEMREWAKSFSQGRPAQEDRGLTKDR